MIGSYTIQFYNGMICFSHVMLITWQKSGARCGAPRVARSGAGDQKSWCLTAQKLGHLVLGIAH